MAIECSATLGRPDANAEDGLAWVDDLTRRLNIPGLAHYGMTAERIPELVTKARAASSMKGNPLPLSDAELTEIVTKSL